MKKAALLAIALLHVGCAAPEPTTFGLAVYYETDKDVGLIKGAFCQYAGGLGSSESWAMLDRKYTPEGAEDPPNLWLHDQQDFSEEKVFTLEAYIATAYENGNSVDPSSKKVLVERRYDEAFGQGGKKDSFPIDFEGVRYNITVKGIPGSVPFQKSCPAEDESVEGDNTMP
jgi:hypothetical protein